MPDFLSRRLRASVIPRQAERLPPEPGMANRTLRGMELSPGLTATVELIVSDVDTAVALRSGDVAVLATPRVLALVEEATVAAVAPVLEPGLTTVGTRVELDHLAATVVGARVVARATLTAVDGRRLGFEVLLTEDDQVAARGRVERAVVVRERFLSRLGAPS
jgi:predicted thioesterase